MSRLKGAPQLRARLKSLKVAFKPIGRKWGQEDVRLNRAHVPVRTGRLRRSFRVRHNSQKRATVYGHFTAYFIDKGTKPHIIRPKRASRLVFQSGGQTIFARKAAHRGIRARPFRARAAREALQRTDVPQALVDAWNGPA